MLYKHFIFANNIMVYPCSSNFLFHEHGLTFHLLQPIKSLQVSSREKASRQCWHRGQSWRWPTCQVKTSLSCVQKRTTGNWRWGTTTGKLFYLFLGVSQSWRCEKAAMSSSMYEFILLHWFHVPRSQHIALSIPYRQGAWRAHVCDCWGVCLCCWPATGNNTKQIIKGCRIRRQFWLATVGGSTFFCQGIQRFAGTKHCEQRYGCLKKHFQRKLIDEGTFSLLHNMTIH